MTTSEARKPVIAIGCVALRQYMIRRLSFSIKGFIDSNWDLPYDKVTGLPVYQSPKELPLPIDCYDFISFAGVDVCDEYCAKFPALHIIAEHPVQLYRVGQQDATGSPLDKLKDLLTEYGRVRPSVGHFSLDKLRHAASGEVICLVIHRLTFGGAERQICLLAKGLRVLGFQVHLVCFFPPNAGVLDMVEELRRNGVTYHVLNARYLIESSEGNVFVDGITKCLVGLFSGVFQEFIIDGLFTYFNRVKPVLLVSYLESSNLLAGIAAVFSQVPTVLMSGRNVSLIELDSPSEFCGSLSLQKDLYLALLSIPNVRFYTNSPKGSESYSRWLELKLMPKVVGNAFHAWKSDRVVSAVRSSNGSELVVGMMARLAPEKAPLRFINVVERLRAQRSSDVRAIYQGSGSLGDDFKNSLRAKGLANYIELRDAQAEVDGFWGGIDIFVLTSESEGTPNVIMECIQRRIPFVTTCLGFLSSIPSNWLHHMLASADIEEICSKVSFLFEHRSEIDWEVFDDFARSHDSKWLALETLAV